MRSIPIGWPSDQPSFTLKLNLHSILHDTSNAKEIITSLYDPSSKSAMCLGELQGHFICDRSIRNSDTYKTSYEIMKNKIMIGGAAQLVSSQELVRAPINAR